MNPSKNGTTAAPKIEAAPVAKAEKALPVIQPAPRATNSQILSFEDRMHKLNLLFAKQQKYSKLQSSLLKLNEFEVAKDGERSRLSISDDSRNDFSTYNPEIVQEVVDFLKIKIQERLKQLEPEINW